MCLDAHNLIRRQKQLFLKRYSVQRPLKEKETRKWASGLHYLSMAFFRKLKQGNLHHTKVEHSVILSCSKLAVQFWIFSKQNNVYRFTSSGS